MLALFVLWILGMIAEMTNQHRQYQANTETKKNVLSLNYLGLRIANDKCFILHKVDIINALKTLYNIASRVADS